MKDSLAPILAKYAASKAARFHMPGHKGEGMGGFWRSDLTKWDVTELDQTDNLHAPTGVLKRAQDACAACYGAKHTFFLVNGSSAGVMAMLLALGRNRRVLLARDCHRSALAGAILAGHDCSYLYPEYETQYGMWGMVSAGALDDALTVYPADAVLITSPNYYGLCADLQALGQIARRHGTLLFVDAAHGAHFPFAQELPEHPALHAHAWVNSAHKTLNALGQAAYLHLGEMCPISQSDVQRALRLVETSSPSYLLLASLDWACYSASHQQNWPQHVERMRARKREIASLAGLRVLDDALVGRAGIAAVDATRVTIDVTERGIDGYTAKRALEERNIFIEMADARRLVLICTPEDPPEWYAQLLDGLARLPYGTMIADAQERAVAVQGEKRCSLREAALSRSEQVPLDESVDCICAEAVGMYPPGIALVVPGETFTREAISLLQAQQTLGATLFGVDHGRVSIVQGETSGE